MDASLLQYLTNELFGIDPFKKYIDFNTKSVSASLSNVLSIFLMFVPKDPDIFILPVSHDYENRGNRSTCTKRWTEKTLFTFTGFSEAEVVKAG